MMILINFDDKTKGIPLDLHSLVTSKGILPAHFAKYRVFPKTSDLNTVLQFIHFLRSFSQQKHQTKQCANHRGRDHWPRVFAPSQNDAKLIKKQCANPRGRDHWPRVFVPSQNDDSAGF